jgi:predicted CXXCH cytochrome family protein
VIAGDGKENLRAVSQFEALAQSKCKRASGDAMTCTSCHDPHSAPSAAAKVAFYRGKCLACHGDAFAAKHHTEQQDCTACHMPRVKTADVAHTQATDHRILRVPVMPLQSVGSAYDPGNVPPSEPKLVRFPSMPVSAVAAETAPATDAAPGSDSPAEARDLALAWEVLAGNSRFAYDQAGKLLPKALEKNPEDAVLLAAQAYHEQRDKKLDPAREHYEHALRLDPLSIDAASNFAVLEANAGHLDHAIALWKSAFERDPGRSSMGLNLARVYCLSGHPAESQAALSRVLEFNPDSHAGRAMLSQLQSGAAKCVPH